MRRRHAEEAIALSRELADTYLIVSSLGCLANVAEAAGEPDLQERLLKEMLMLCRDSGDRESMAISHLNLATLSMRRGSPQGTREQLLEVLAIAQETGSKRMQGWVLGVSMELAAYLRDWSRAARLYGASVAHMEATGIAYEPEGPEEARPERVRAALGSSAFTAATGKGRELGSNRALAEVRAWLEVAPGIW
jgi:hypothetical protein